MTQDEIIHMARYLVIRHGIRMCDEDGDMHGEELYCVGIEDIAEIIKEVAAAEREACAKVCKELHNGSLQEFGAIVGEIYNEDCAAAIRVRGENK